jgi:hypothetical protein
VEIGTEAAQFPEKKYINGIFVAMQPKEKENKQRTGYTTLDNCLPCLVRKSVLP